MSDDDQQGKFHGDERSGETDRRSGEHRREDDRWLRDLIQGLIDSYNRRIRKILVSMSVGYFFLLIGFSLGLYFLERNDNRAQDRSAVASCERVNKLRVQTNQVAEAAWATVYISAAREQRLADTGPPAQRGVHRRSSNGLSFIASQFHRTDETDCRRAIFHADSYDPPHPENFDPTQSQILKDLIRLVGVPT